MANLIEVKVPDIGDFTDISVIEILVKPGDSIKKEDSLISLESDKATMEVPSTHAGVVKEIKVKLGDKVSMGTVVLVLDASDATAAPSIPAGAPAQTQAPARVSEAPMSKVVPAPSLGKRRLSTATISRVSSSESVVCVR